MASSWIISAQYGHFFTAFPSSVGIAQRLPQARFRPCGDRRRRGGSVACRAMGERIAVLVSGNGTNLQALLDDPFCGPRIALVLADRPAIRALRARRAAWRRDARDRAVVVPGSRGVRRGGGRRPAAARRRRRRDRRLHAPARTPRCCTSTVAAGSTRTRRCCPRSRHARVRDALEHGVKVTGVTVFWSTRASTRGRSCCRRRSTCATTTTGMRSRRGVLEVEHRLLPRAVRALVEGRLVVEGRHVTITEEHDG